MVKMSPKKAKAPDAAVSSDGSEAAEPVVTEPTIELRGLAAHHYRAELRWPPGSENFAVEVNGVILASGSSAKVQKFGFALEKNSNYLVKFYRDTAGATPAQTPWQWDFTTPVDIELPDAKIQAAMASANPKLELRANRVFLNKNKDNTPSLVTFGRELVIDTKELISNGGSLITFISGQKADSDMPGRSGGSIRIKANSARGELSIEMRGEHGGDGSSGAPFAERAPSGAAGTSGQSHRQMGSGSFPSFCVALPTSGGNGENGANGRNGQNGRRGGNTGQLTFEVAEKSDAFQLHFSKEVGRSGKAGAGGPGQLGGIGGEPGARDIFRVCPYKVGRGADGANGAGGANGVNEGDGSEEQECLSLGEGFGRCSTR
jgi:hypothetical protein